MWRNRKWNLSDSGLTWQHRILSSKFSIFPRLRLECHQLATRADEFDTVFIVIVKIQNLNTADLQNLTVIILYSL